MDVVVTSIKKIIADSQLKYNIPVQIKYNKKDADSTAYKVSVVENVPSGSTQFNIVDSESLLILDVDLVGMVLTDGSYDDKYTVIGYANGVVTLENPLLRDISANEIFEIDVINIVKIFEAPSYIDKTKVVTKGLRVRVKPFDITISCKDDEGERADKIDRWLTYILSNEHYRCYDGDGNLIGTQVFYTYKKPVFTDIGKEVNNSLHYGRVSFMIYEDYCDSFNKLI